MKKLSYILFWTLFGLAGLAAQYYVTKWATETEKDPDLQETVQFTPDQYPAVAASIKQENLKAHISALSAIPSRMTGTPGCEKAATYVMDQFRALGFGEPQVQEFPVTIPVFTRAEIKIATGSYKLHPLYPNGVCPAALPKDGFSTRLVYAGNGSLTTISGKDIQGATVVIESGAREQWLYLIDLGARAVIFVEGDRPPRFMDSTTQTMSHQDVPRFWMTKKEAAPLLAAVRAKDLKAVLFSDAHWETRTGKNIWIDLPGLSTTEHNKDELIVLDAYYDSSSFVPDLAPGAEQACGIASLLELGKFIAEHPFQKRVRLLATAGHFQALEGIRRYVWEQVGQYDDIPMRVVAPKGHAAFLALELSSGTQRLGLLHSGNFFPQLGGNLKPRMSDLGRRAGKYAKEIATALNRPADWIFVDTINPAMGKDWNTYLPTPLAIEHEAALLGGIPSLGFVTLNDARFFTATPNDKEVNLANLQTQVQTLACMLPNAFNVEGRYLKRSLARPICRVSGQAVSFDPKEGYLPSKPIPNAVVLFRTVFDRQFMTGVATRPITLSNEKGEFTMIGMPTAAEVLTAATPMVFQSYEVYVLEDGHITWAPDFGSMGRENYPTTLIPVQKEMKLMAVAFPCKTLDVFNLVDPRTYNFLNTLSILESESNSRPPVFGSTLVEYKLPWISYFSPTASIFVPEGKHLKITAGAGAAQKRLLLLNVPEQKPEGKLFNTGEGFDVDKTPAIHNTDLQGASDLWRLNDSRIHFFEAHGIRNARVTTLHGMAGEALAKAREALSLKNYQEYMVQARRALGLESRAYPDVVGMANDVVRGLVFYLILLIPFAFAMERLFLAGRRIETRILGIVAMFLAMFTILRFTHPAFQIVLSPMVVLLGFSVAALSVVIISIVMAKLEALVSKQKVEQQGEHESNVQAVSGFALALELGIANMRRRRMRTVLTSITLILLTFSVLSFVSVTAALRTQEYVYKEGATPYKGVLLRTKNWMPFPFETYASLRNEYGKICTVAPRRWYYGALNLDRSYVDIQMGEAIRAGTSLVGLTEQESQLTDVKSALLGNSRWLSTVIEGKEPKEEILLPVNLVKDFTDALAKKAPLTQTYDAMTPLPPPAPLTEAEKVQLANDFIGKKVRVLGREFEVIGVFDWEKMNSLVDIDGESLTPFDPVQMTQKFMNEGAPDSDSVLRYIHQSFKDVPIMDEHVLGNLGGDLRSVAMLPNDPQELKPMLDSLVKRLDYILFANLNDQPTLLSSRNATRISELWNLLVLMVIAGLIVFNTMLGSVFERTKEIATYTALGIAPSHIGRLFLVEAVVFGVLGVMAGYVFGQTFSRVVQLFNIPLELNYSSMAGVGACLLVMGMVMLSSIYPARKASELGVPDIERRWKLPRTKEPTITLNMPFTVSLAESQGLVEFLKEYLDSHVDVSVGNFYVEGVKAGTAIAVAQGASEKATGVTAQCWLTPFDLGVSQHTTFILRLMEDMSVCSIEVKLERLSGDAGSWRRANGYFMTAMRGQFLMWRNLKPEARADYVARGKDYAIV